MKSEITDRRDFICRENLNNYQYTISLLRAGFQVKLLNQTNLNSIQEQIMLILKDLILRYTKGDSTSVTTDTAETLLNSILYSLDAYLSQFEHPEDGINLLKTNTVQKIYAKGIELISRWVAETQDLYEEIKRTKLDVQLEVYNTSIDEDLPDFFKQYGIMFNAHDTMCTLDYPLVFDDMKLQGIRYIKHYLETLKTETQFCNLFDKKTLENTLVNYSRIYQIDYKTSPINIFEVLINNSIFSVLIGNQASELTIFTFQFQILEQELSQLSPTELIVLIDKGIKKVLSDFNLNQPDLVNYLNKYKSIIVQRTLTAVENNSLHNLIITTNAANQQGDKINFNPGIKMNDQDFRIILGKIINCDSIENKIALIRSDIPSLEDFIDILRADCLFGDEFITVYRTLSLTELAVLGKMLFSEELRTGELNLSQLQKKDNLPDWELYYIKYLQRLSKSHLERLEKVMMQIDL